ncbi:hypothetical protein [Cellulomonas massiliensis]|uniref:hypothetical protein n=1 Tax=Cellulomonas massiliensis TaxID=1465811 RepID=UPI0002FD3090|nr:hypothetical protein [Cellulomonas massiliensis]
MTLAVVLAGAGLLAGASGADALPQRVPVSFSFEGMLPGEQRTQTRTTTIARDARVSEARVVASGGDGVTWTAELCRGRTCVDLLAARRGTPLAAGTYDLVVSATAGTLAPGATAALDGRLSLVENDDLAFTGGDDPEGDGPDDGADGDDGTATGPGGPGLAFTGSTAGPLAGLAAALTALGALLVLVGRRRREDEEEAA